MFTLVYGVSGYVLVGLCKIRGTFFVQKLHRNVLQKQVPKIRRSEIGKLFPTNKTKVFLPLRGFFFIAKIR